MFYSALHSRTTRSAMLLTAFMASTALVLAQAPTARQSGTVKAIEGNTITVTTAAGASVTVPVAPSANVLQVPAGSTDLKTAQPATLADISIGDRVVVGKAGDTDTASRVIVMKSSDIAARKQAQQVDWQKRGTGGLVKAVDGPVFTVSSGARTLKVQTTPTTIFRRYADDSVRFEDARMGTLDQVHAGDQLSVRGTHSDDNASITAEEVVTGTFSNLSGVLSGVDAAAGTLTLKDLTTKKAVTVKVTANSDIRKLPAQAAAMFTARGNATAPGTSSGAGPAGGQTRSGARLGGPGVGGPGVGGPGGSGMGGSGMGGPGAPGSGDRSRSAGMDLSRMLARLPTAGLADLKAGDAVMIVASQERDGYTAITLLSGVEALLAAPAGSQPITLSPWNLGAPEGGGGGGGR